MKCIVSTCFALLLFCNCAIGVGQDGNDKLKGTDSAEANARSIDFDALVKSLKNSNDPPKIKGGWNVYFEKDYDFSEQRRINKVIQTLMIYVEEAWEPLVQNLDNDAYSYTFGYGGSSMNYTVGQVCHQLQKNSISAGYSELYALFQNSGIADHTLENPVLMQPAQLLKWLNKQGNATLADLQIQAIREFVDRLSQEKISEALKVKLKERADEIADAINRDKIPKPVRNFIPRRETWTYLKPEK